MKFRITPPEGKHPWRDLGIYFGVGAGAVAAVLIYASNTESKDSFAVQRLAVIAETAMVFGYTLKAFREYWTKVLFWITGVLLFVFHVLVCLLLLQNFKQIPLFWLASLATVEFYLILFVMSEIVETLPGDLSDRDHLT